MVEANRSDVARQHAVFARMWVVAGWFHLVNQNRWPSFPWEPTPARVIIELLMLVAGVAVFRAPRRAGPFLAFVLLEVAHALRDVPRVANHWYLTLLITLVITGAAWTVWRRDGRLDVASWLEQYGPGVRVVLVVGYFFAAWAKLNADFINPEVSCASEYWRRIGTWVTIMPQGPFFDLAAIWVTIVVELAVPLLLLWPRYRYVALMVGIPFHYLISFSEVFRVPDFATMLFAVWWLFLPAQVSRRVAELLRPAEGQVRRRVSWTMVGVGVGVVIYLGLSIIGTWGTYERFNGWDQASNWLKALRSMYFLFYGLGVYGLLLLALRNPKGEVEPTPGIVRVRGAWPMLIVAVALFSGLNPYLGLRTRATFVMFSNMRTEEHQPNHLLMPQIYLLPHQLEVVDVLQHDIPELRMERMGGIVDSSKPIAAGKMRLTWWELRYWAQRYPERPVTWARDGVTHQVAKASDDPGLMAPMAPLEDRWFAYQAVVNEDGGKCSR